jgi:Protein of unknown function (DUF4232)/Putative zinc-finger
MSCDQIRHLISESYDRRLSPAERREVAEHLRSCLACARFARNLRTSLERITHLPEIAPSPALWEAVHTQSALKPGLTPSRLLRQAGGMLGAAVAVALVAALTIFLFRNHLAPSTSNNPIVASGTLASPTEQPALATAATAPSPFVAASTATAAVALTVPSTPVPSPSATSAAIATSTAAASPTPVVDEQSAEATVNGYFDAINSKDYATAYGYLGTNLQQQQAPADFINGYDGTDHDTLSITGTKTGASGEVIVVIVLDAKQTNGTIRHYHGEYVVGYEEGRLRIVDASVVEDLPATPTASPDASLPVCLPTSLAATADYQGATGSMAGSIILTNTGTEQCRLEGVPQVQLRDRSGQVLAVDQKTMSVDGNEQPVTLSPGQQASVFFVWSNWCPPGTPETSAASPIPGGISFQVTVVGNKGAIIAPAQHEDGSTVALLPRCDAPGATSTLAVGPFTAYPAP